MEQISNSFQALPRTARQTIAIGFLLCLWELSVRTFATSSAEVIPPPTTLVRYIVENWGLLLEIMQPTLFEAVIGFLSALLISVALAMTFVRFPSVEATIGNAIVLIHSLPMLAIVPLLTMWFGTGYAPKIIMAALAAYFPILNGTLRGLRSADPAMLDLMHLLNASSFQTLWKIRIPASLPHIFAALKIAAPQAVLGATIAEWIGSRAGLGAQILLSLLNYDLQLLWTAMMGCALLAGSGFVAIVLLEKAVIGGRFEPQREEF